jgi:hypothetical protein
VDTSYHQSIRQAHKIIPFCIEQEHPHISVMVNTIRNFYLLIAVGKHSLLLRNMDVLQKKRAHLVGLTGVLLDVCRVNINLLKL